MNDLDFVHALIRGDWPWPNDGDHSSSKSSYCSSSSSSSSQSSSNSALLFKLESHKQKRERQCSAPPAFWTLMTRFSEMKSGLFSSTVYARTLILCCSKPVFSPSSSRQFAHQFFVESSLLLQFIGERLEAIDLAFLKLKSLQSFRIKGWIGLRRLGNL